MDNSSVFLHQLYSPGGSKGLAALKNAPTTHPQEWANRNPYTMVSILHHAWSANLPELANWVVEHVPSPMSNFPSLLSESIKHDNIYVSDLLVVEFEKFTNQNFDQFKSERIGLSAACTAAECGKMEYLLKITQIMHNYFICGQFERIAVSGAAHKDVIEHLWNDLSEPGKIHVAAAVVCANNTDVIEWVAQRVSSDYWADVELDLDDAQKNMWRDHTAVVQRTRLKDQTQPTVFSAPPKKI